MLEDKLRVGIYTLRNPGGGLADFLSFEARTKAAAKALDLRTVELLGIELTNPHLEDVLRRGGFVPTTIEVPEELGGGVCHAISRVEQVE